MYVFNAEMAADACVRWIRKWFDENGKGCNAVIGISGGKDSTVVAALCVKALGRDRVIGVMMPNGIQPDIADSREIIRNLGIRAAEHNIKDAYDAMLGPMTDLQNIARATGFIDFPSRQAKENLPPRLRMAALYLVAQCFNGRVSITATCLRTGSGTAPFTGTRLAIFRPFPVLRLLRSLRSGVRWASPNGF